MKEEILNKYRIAASNKRPNQPYSWLNYQPINLPGYEDTIPLRGRDCFDRSEAIFRHLQMIAPPSVRIVDWGCNLGFFCFEGSKRDYKTIGVDENEEFSSVCSFLSETNTFKHKPEFFSDTLNQENIKKYPADVAFCFSVLHHLMAEDRVKTWKLLQEFATAYPTAYIEMDGPNFGQYDLSLFYFNVSEVVESNDRYGSRTKTRRTLYCSNLCGDIRYTNIKKVNKVYHRDVFKKTLSNGASSVIKRESVNKFQDDYSHTWIKTNLSHEKYIYEKYKSNIFPNVFSWNTDDEYHKMEMEYFEPYGKITLDGLNNIYNFLKENNLFIIDLVRDMFIPTKDGLKLIDVESIFEIEGNIENTIKRNIKKTKRTPYDSYEKQINVIKQIYKV